MKVKNLIDNDPLVKSVFGSVLDCTARANRKNKSRDTGRKNSRSILGRGEALNVIIKRILRL